MKVSTMQNSTYIFTEDYIEHHGVLGQKWGVRRYQNKDGSLTPAGRVHSHNGLDMSLGYNAIIDDNNRGIYNGAQKPILDRDPNNTLKRRFVKDFGSPRLSDYVINKNLNKVIKTNKYSGFTDKYGSDYFL